MKKIILIFLIIFSFSYGKSDLYFLPDESNKAFTKLEKLILNSEKSIKIAMYNFTYKKLAKLLIKASKNGVKVEVIMDKKKVTSDTKSQYKRLKDNNIIVHLPKNKLHIKMAIFDNKTAVFGSANWKKKSFKKDYEILYFSKNNQTVDKLKEIFEKLLNNS